jgi:hypothetical protein
MWFKILDSSGSTVAAAPESALAGFWTGQEGSTWTIWTTVTGMGTFNIPGSYNSGNGWWYRVAIGLPDQATALQHIQDLVGEVSP